MSEDTPTDETPIMVDRPADLTLGLNQNRIGTFDLDEFSQRVDQTFEWFKEDHKTYANPSFALVQSSGMGKTKLMKDYRDHFMHNNNDESSSTFVKLILCRNSHVLLPRKFKEYYDYALNIPPTYFVSEEHCPGTAKADRENNIKARNQVFCELDNIISETDNKSRIVLLFDESQFLVQGDAGIYISIQWWLRQVRDRNVVAVFAGTLVSLANYQFYQHTLSWTREDGYKYNNYVVKSWRNDEQKLLYPPFYTLTTMGLERIIRSRNVDEWDKATEAADDQMLDIRRHGYFGRPLFAAMLKILPGETRSYFHLTEASAQGNRIISNNLYTVVRRMLHSNGTLRSWFEKCRKEKLDALASILATRTQLGTASYEFVKDAIEKGYACLVHCSTHDESKEQGGGGYGLARVEYSPDPICAAMAMGLMTPKWQVAKQYKNEVDVITGVKPKKWVEVVGEIFDQQMFLPNRNNEGEVFAALYMLLCADALRWKTDKLMRKFEVDLQSWFHQVVESKTILKDFIPGEFYVNFIQITRNYFRSDSFLTQRGLELMYELAVGCYVYSNYPGVDIVVPVKDGTGNYYPMLISVKCWDECSQSQMRNELNLMKTYLADARPLGGAKAICVLFLLGSERVDEAIMPQGQFPKEDTFVTIVIPEGDKYGVNEGLTRRMTRSIKQEVLESQLFAQVEDPEATEKSLHSKANADDIAFAKNVIEDKKMREGNLKAGN